MKKSSVMFSSPISKPALLFDAPAPVRNLPGLQRRLVIVSPKAGKEEKMIKNARRNGK